jgi:hypothetical protein
MTEGGRNPMQDLEAQEATRKALEEAERAKQNAEASGASDYLDGVGEVVLGAVELAFELITLPLSFLE